MPYIIDVDDVFAAWRTSEPAEVKSVICGRNGQNLKASPKV